MGLVLIGRNVLYHASSIRKSVSLVSGPSSEFISGSNFPREIEELCGFCKSAQNFSTSNDQTGRICWESSTHAALLRKLEVALKGHQVNEAWVIYNDFKNLYGFPSSSVVGKFITALSYSFDRNWLEKAYNLVLVTAKEKPGLLQPETLSKLSLSLARAQMPVPASMILRMMLERENVPSGDVLWLIVLHMVKSEIGACLASNFLVEMCGCVLSVRGEDHGKLVKPDTMFFNLVLNACVRFKFSLKGHQLVELMAQTGVIADAHSIIIIAQIHEMNGQKDDLKKFKDHVDRVSSSFLYHYRQFYDSLLSLYFRIDDIDAAAGLMLDMQRSHSCVPTEKPRKDIHKSYFVPIGSENLKSGLKLQIIPEMLQKDSVLKVVSKQDLVACKDENLVPTNKGVAKLITGFRRHGRITELSKLLVSIQKDTNTVGGSTLCADVVDACICLGWLEMAHDILDNMETAGAPLSSITYSSLLTAYRTRGMLREAKALIRQMRKTGLGINLSDEMIDSNFFPDASCVINKSDLADILVRNMQDDVEAIPPLVYEINSSIYFFCKAKMIEDALKSYRRMQDKKVKPTVQTFAYLVHGYASLEMYRDITILWGDIKRRIENKDLVVSRDLFELLLLNFIRGGYFERVMEIVGHMKERNMYTDKWMYKSEFLKLHKNLYKSLKASEARTEAQSKRLEYVQTFRKWVGIG